MNKQRKACFIIPYFGKLPETMPIYLRTCAKNIDFDWLIITDDRTEYDYPANVHCSYSTFDAFVQRVQSHFDFPISLKRPYKICDFRAAFGVIFEEELKKYQFWGHCDLDQYFGNINHFITDDILENYDKILCLGHFTMFRNTPRINNLYLIPDKKWGQSYKDAFSQEKHWIFDEWPAGNTCINRICKQEGVRTYYHHDAFCDLVPFVSRFQRYIFDHEKEDWEKEPIKNTVFVWDDGELYCYHKDQNSQIVKCEMMYVHIRQRKMDSSKYVPKHAVMCFYPNVIVSYEDAKCVGMNVMLRHSFFRSLMCPDEMARKLVLLNGYWNALKRRFILQKG